MPVPGLYQTGGTTHPGGSITGAPGRNAAIVLLNDLGHDPAAIMSAPSGQGRAVTVAADPSCGAGPGDQPGRVQNSPSG
jgi:hypothetical protein